MTVAGLAWGEKGTAGRTARVCLLVDDKFLSPVIQAILIILQKLMFTLLLVPAGAALDGEVYILTSSTDGGQEMGLRFIYRVSAKINGIILK